MMKAATHTALVAVILFAGPAFAQGLPHLFQAGETARASDVNANFAYLAPANVVQVSPAASGSAVDNGAALRHAMQNIQFVNGSPAADNPYLVEVAPGLYDLGATPLQLRSFVLLEGAGRSMTRITSSVDVMASGTMLAVDDAEVRNLTIENSHAGSFAVAIYAGGASAVFEDVTVRAVGGVDNRGLSTNNGALVLRRASIEVSGGTRNYGIYNWMAPSQLLDDVSIKISSGAGAANYGLWSNASTLELRRVDIEIDGPGSDNYGVYNTNESTLLLSDSNILLDGLSGTTYHCLHFTDSSYGGELVRVTLDVQNGGGSGKSGLFTQTPSRITVHQSRLRAADSIHAEGMAQVRAGASQVSWFVASTGSVRCTACYDASFLAESCL